MVHDCALTETTVCAIISACGQSGVRVLKFGGLYISFIAPRVKREAPQVSTEPDHTAQNVEALERDEGEVRAERIRMLMIENPMEYESLLRDGELDDEPGESELDE